VLRRQKCSGADAKSTENRTARAHFSGRTCAPARGAGARRPGAIIASVLLTENDRFDLHEQLATALVVLAIFLVTYAMFAGAQLVQKLIGATGAMVLSRVLGLILSALAIQTLLEGLRPFLASLR
jgi:small neutral amino acid transporter SnatA (MarC family)